VFLRLVRPDCDGQGGIEEDCAAFAGVFALSGCKGPLPSADVALNGLISVRDFGTKGDGVTDDTAAIKAGLNFLAARGGGKLCFPDADK